MTAPEWDAGTPYAGPPVSGPPHSGPAHSWAAYDPPPYGPPGYPPAGWGQAPYQHYPPYPSYPPYQHYPPYPLRPQRPGTVVAAAVLAFVSALLVVLGTLYAVAFSALLDLARAPDAGIGPWTALLQLLLAGVLLAGGLRMLARDRRWLLGAAAAQLLLCCYWVVVLAGIGPATVGDSVMVLPAGYAALALVAAGLSFLPDARAWTAGRSGPPDGGAWPGGSWPGGTWAGGTWAGG